MHYGITLWAYLSEPLDSHKRPSSTEKSQYRYTVCSKSRDHTLLLLRGVNPLPTNDAIWPRQILAQSVLKIGSALAERVGQGEVGGCTALADSAWRRLQLPVEKPWSMPGGPFVCFLAQTGVENAPFTL